MTENPDSTLAKDMGRFFDDPLGFVMYAFPWDSDTSLQMVKLPDRLRKKYKVEYGPDEWACDFLEELGREVRARGFDGKKSVMPIRGAVTSGHGIGKSALTAWIVLWIMSTRPHAQGTVTANTSPQLETKTWAQIAKWKKICITSHWFEITASRGSMKMWHIFHRETWFCSAQTCREENSESFAGQHAANSTSFYVFDEGSAVPDKIKEVAEGGLTDGEPMMFAFGNPTRTSGWFRECFGKAKHRWFTRKVDSRTVQITNKELLKSWEDDNGVDSDFFKVRVRGEFPSKAINQLISQDLVDTALKRRVSVHQYSFAPIVLGVDVAWEGDDRSCVYLRQGLAAKRLGVWHGIDNMTLGGLVNQWWSEYKADAVFIDVGWGTGVIDYLRRLGREPIPINFGGKSFSEEYANKRTEMWCELLKGLEAGLALIEGNDDLIDDLTGPEYYFLPNGKKMLESKDSIKRRGLRSPDIADALALTYAAPVIKSTRNSNGGAREKSKAEYDVLEGE